MRKSANETLFATLATHGDIFSIQNWFVIRHEIDTVGSFTTLLNRQVMVWKTLFPLLENVQSLSRSAPSAPEVSQIIVHHSRNTTAKQWEETRALALTGVARVFCAQYKFVK